ncbi:MAG: CBS domain-containing protein [Spirochaetales bacterium]|nr:CBS domain-containing protein [Candidatus Physcosoma equi]
MTVSKRMTANPVTCTPDMGVFEAAELMKKEGVSRLPVLNEDGNLVGIVSEKNIINAEPSHSEGRVSIVEFAHLLSSLKVKDVMSKEVITVYTNDPVEQAARKMCDYDITILPVVDYNGKLVGVVTRSDMFRLLLALFGTRHYGIRLSFSVQDEPGTIAKISATIDKLGANIISIGNIDGLQGESTIIMKVNGIEKEKLAEAIKPLVKEIIDIREV